MTWGILLFHQEERIQQSSMSPSGSQDGVFLAFVSPAGQTVQMPPDKMVRFPGTSTFIHSFIHSLMNLFICFKQRITQFVIH